MDIVDFHAHFFPDEIAQHAVKTVTEICDGVITPELDGTLKSLLAGMKETGISSSVTLPVATKPEQVESINSSLTTNNSSIIPFGALNPFSENWEKDIDHLVSIGVKGVKLHPEYQGFYIDKPQFFPFYEKIADAGLIALFHTGYDPGPFSRDHATPSMVKSMIQAVPKLKVVTAHLGGLLMWDEVLELLVGENIWLDTSAIAGRIPPEQFEKICNQHDAEKILFGSDTPWESQQSSIDFITRSNLEESVKESILGENARKLLNLNG